MVTTEAAHSGKYSLKFNLPFNRVPHDGFVGTKRYMLDGSSAMPPGMSPVSIAYQLAGDPGW